jgi:hypothetical protein
MKRTAIATILCVGLGAVVALGLLLCLGSDSPVAQAQGPDGHDAHYTGDDAGCATYSRQLGDNGLTVPVCLLGRFALSETVQPRMYLPFVLRQSPQDRPPLAMDDTASTLEDIPVRIDVAANDTDPDGNLDPGSANTECGACLGTANGMLANNGNSTFDYVPDPDFYGADNFVYEICDTDGLCDTAIVSITVTAVNDAPAVDAGTNQTVTLPALALLDGTISDDGLPDPPGAVTTTWSQANGPGLVTFSDVHAVDTSASFAAAGVYVLRLTADDGALVTSDEVRVTVNLSTATLVGAGDIAGCGGQRDEETAELLDRIGGTVFTLGDNVYPDGTAAQFADCYDPTWGQYVARTRPAAGNHDYHTPGASGYFGYFGAAAGDVDKGYYSYDVGGWHIVVLNSNCAEVGGCDSKSPQGQWLQSDLAANPSTARWPTGTHRCSVRVHITVAAPPCAISGKRSMTPAQMWC